MCYFLQVQFQCQQWLCDNKEMSVFEQQPSTKQLQLFNVTLTESPTKLR